MKHFLFFLTLLSLIFFSESLVYAQKPCIKVNGANPTTSTVAGEPPYAYKCASNSIHLEVIDCSGNFIDPSQYESIVWHDSSTPRFDINGPITLDVPTGGIWTVIIKYTDPIYATTTLDSAKVKIIDYPSPSGSNQLLITNSQGNPAPHCKNDIMTFNATTSNFYVTGSYKWFANTTALDTTTTIIATGTTITTSINTSTNVTVMATDVNGCKQRATIPTPLKQYPIQPNLGADFNKCSGTSVTLNAYTSPPIGYTYFWNGAASGTSDPTFPITAGGKYWVTVEKFPSLPCKIADTIYVYDLPAPNFTVGNDTSICYQANGALHAKSSSTLTYTWTPSTYFPGGNTGANPVIDFNGVGLGTYIISVTGKDINNCTATKTQNVIHLGQGSNPYMFVTANPIDICNGSTRKFNTVATATYSTSLKYEWTPALHLNKDTAYRPVVDLTGESLGMPFNYTLKVSDAAGCYLTINTSATLVPSVVANVGFSDSSLCVGKNITLLSSGTGGTGSLTYTWSPSTDLSDPAIPNPVTTPTDNRLYTITVSDSKGCQDSKIVDIKAIDIIVKLFATDTSGYAIEPMVLNPYANSNTYTYQWTNVTTSTTLGTTKSQLAEETAAYAVYATEPASGCHAYDTINVTLQVGNPRLLYVPNVVNPASANADNKTVKVYGTAVQENDFTFRIYNKWGEMIYETTSFNDANTNGWNGVYKTSNGTEQNLSVYTYSLHGKYFDGQEFDKTGSITLMR